MIVHVLLFGQPLCRFSDEVPGKWPEGHKWVRTDEVEDATCEPCRQALREMTRSDEADDALREDCRQELRELEGPSDEGETV